MSNKCQCAEQKQAEFSHYGNRLFNAYRIEHYASDLRIDYTRDGDVRFVFTGGGRAAASYSLSVWSMSDIIERLFEIRDFAVAEKDAAK